MTAPLGGLLAYFRRLAPEDADDVLLLRFARGDGEAFAALVGRHAPLVWGVCRRLLGHSPDAEDAFQATFVILARKAAGLGGGPLAPWLHKVARDTASRARTRAARHRAREAVAAANRPAAQPDPAGRELGEALEEELGRLPGRYRAPVVLCYLEGLTNEEASLRLGCPKGTIASRLARARERLRAGLARRGLDLPSVVPLAAGGPPTGLTDAVASAGTALAAGGAGGLSGTVMTLAKGAVIGMFLRKLEVVALAALALGLAATGAGWASRKPADPPARKPNQLAAVAPGADAEQPLVKAEERGRAKVISADELMRLLNAPYDFYGTDGPDLRLSLAEVMDHITIGMKLPIMIDGDALKSDGVERGMMAEVAKEGLPSMSRSTPTAVLKMVLARVPAKSGAIFLLRNDRIEVTTWRAFLRELGPASPKGKEDDTQRPLPLVRLSFRDSPLEKALNDIADASGYNVVLDGRLKEKGKTPVTARLLNVPADTAARVLADMAGLSVVRLDNVLYVTSPENAAKLAAEKPLSRPGERGVGPHGGR
jgi:RNA polymerase sigma factor (sigma-70 family)